MGKRKKLPQQREKREREREREREKRAAAFIDWMSLE